MMKKLRTINETTSIVARAEARERKRKPVPSELAAYLNRLLSQLESLRVCTYMLRACVSCKMSFPLSSGQRDDSRGVT